MDNVVGSRPASVSGKADVLWEEMGIGTIGATGVRVQAPRGGLAEITLGRAISQQGLATTLKRPVVIVKSKTAGGFWSGA